MIPRKPHTVFYLLSSSRSSSFSACPTLLLSPLLLLLLLSSLHRTSVLALEPSKVELDSTFKWEANLAPRWTAPFMGSNDKVPDLPLLEQCLSPFSASELELVSVVGGMKYLEIMERVEFARIHFFDANINELTKLRIVHSEIVANDYDAWTAAGGFRAVQRRIVGERNHFFLPAALFDDGVRLAPRRSDFHWPHPSRHVFQDEDYVAAHPERPRRVGDLWTLFDPDLFPEFAWWPSREGYERVRAMLSDPSVVGDTFFTSPPVAVTSPSRLAVIWCDGAGIPRDRARLVSPNNLALPFYSDTGSSLGNSLWFDAHLWWENAVRLSLVPRRNSLHIWAREDESFSGTLLDWPFTSAGVITAIDFDHPELRSYDGTVVVHMLLGKAKNQGGAAADCAAVANLYLLLLQTFTQAPRVVITEHNAASGQFPAAEFPCAVAAETLVSFLIANASVEEAFAPEKKFRVSRLRSLPGEGEADRNFLIALDNNNVIPPGEHVSPLRVAEVLGAEADEVFASYIETNLSDGTESPDDPTACMWESTDTPKKDDNGVVSLHRSSWGAREECVAALRKSNMFKPLPIYFPKGGSREGMIPFAARFLIEHDVYDLSATTLVTEAMTEPAAMVLTTNDIFDASRSHL